MASGKRSLPKAAVLLALVSLVLVACANASSKPPIPSSVSIAATPTELQASGVERAGAGSASTTALVAGNNAFGYELYARAAKAGGNVVYSPLSISVALSMARAGANGATASEIDSVLRFPTAQRDAAMNALLLALATQATAPPTLAPAASTSDQTPPTPILTIANGLFVQKGLPIGAPFLRTMAADYGAGVHTVDFSSADATAEINAWVRVQTAQRIQQLFDALDPATKFAIANAVYLKAAWETPFAEYPTTIAPFTTADGKHIAVPTMHQSEVMGYAATAMWQAVALPYAGGTLALWVIVPTGDTPLGDLLSPSTLSQVSGGLRPIAVNLALPSWTSTTTLDLGAALQQLGIHTAFSSAADFSGIAPGLQIAEAIHRATITVNEWGSEAAAVTGLAFAVSSMETSVTVQADHPFAFAIVHVPTGAVLFEGSVADPTAG